MIKNLEYDSMYMKTKLCLKKHVEELSQRKNVLGVFVKTAFETLF